MIDLAGEDEGAVPAGHLLLGSAQSAALRDATALTIVQVDLETLADPLIAAPTYLVVHRKLWTGGPYPAVRRIQSPGRAVAAAAHRGRRHRGGGRAGFLPGQAFPSQVKPFIFTGKSKSELGWKFLSIIESGRFKDYLSDNDPLSAIFQRQLENCAMEILPGANKLMRWGVPDGLRDPASGEPVHDDLLVSAALCAVLDDEKWGTSESVVIPRAGSLEEDPKGFYNP